MQSIKTLPRRTKRFVHRHRVGIAVTATVVVMAKINRQAIGDMTNFLKDKGLWEEYLSPEAVAEALQK